MIRIWDVSVCSLDCPAFVQFCSGTTVVSRVSGTQDEEYQGTIIIYRFIYTPVTCVHVKPAQPTPSTAPPLPCETIPLRGLPLQANTCGGKPSFPDLFSGTVLMRVFGVKVLGRIFLSWRAPRYLYCRTKYVFSCNLVGQMTCISLQK